MISAAKFYLALRLPDREAAEQAGLYFPSVFVSFLSNAKMKA